MQNNNEFKFDFWKIDMRERFDLNRMGCEILSHFIYHEPEVAKRFIIDTYQMKVQKCDILDDYCEKYDSEKINAILKQIEFDELTEDEIQDYGIRLIENEEEEL